ASSQAGSTPSSDAAAASATIGPAQASATQAQTDQAARSDPTLPGLPWARAHRRPIAPNAGWTATPAQASHVSGPLPQNRQPTATCASATPSTPAAAVTAAATTRLLRAQTQTYGSKAA